MKNYIDQSQEFTLCAVALAYPVVQLLRAGKIWQALALCAISLCLIANMVFVVVSRTALVTLPILLAMFRPAALAAANQPVDAWRGGRPSDWSPGSFRSERYGRASRRTLCAAHPLPASPEYECCAARDAHARRRSKWTFKTFSRDYQLYEDENIPTSFGERFTYWKYALKFIADAPLVGHGTGSSKGLFEQAAHEPDWAKGIRVFPNPHNQTLNVAIQWGALGVAVLYAMWLMHLCCFAAMALRAGSGCSWWCRISSPPYSTRTSSISTKAGCTCSASESRVEWC